MPINDVDINRLEKIKEEIKELAREAFDILPRSITRERAKAYWFAQLIIALDDDHDYLDGASISLQDTIDELKEEMETKEQ